ncbi:unnamed protein product [Notodromas monacha]|uniref:glutathione transferase n=1 Tax=Notodromas monacha TaxID=399045 RepID=A0A7R9BNK1_9CRUS|nr:unnamed protein product [Notodromas monacha]CAG0918809.1 unnamed protein product [Notodromas monacha]
MSPQYKLIYFDVAGRGEIIRLILHQAGVHFEDQRINKEKWAELKPTVPFGQLPVLEVDGKLLAQSHTIARYLANAHGLAGKNSWESALCDQYVDAIIDLTMHYRTMRYGKSDAEKEEAKKTLLESALPVFCQRMTTKIDANPSGLLVSDEVTWADIYLAHGMDVLEAAVPDCLEPYPRIKKIQEHVFGLPNLKAYLDKRDLLSFETAETMVPKYKLLYFDVPGRGEVIRMLFHYAGEPFVDERIPREEWPTIKSTTPFGQVPVLEVNGQRLGQSHAIARYVARELHLTGNTAWDSAQCDQYVDAMIDLLSYFVVWKYSGRTDAEKEAAEKTLFSEALPQFCQRISSAISNNSSGLLVCDKVTWADIYLTFVVQILDGDEKRFDTFPAIKELANKVLSKPTHSENIKEMAPTYKLIYFDMPGRAEFIRMLLHQAGVEFEDFRFPREAWPSLKPEMPFGQVPVLEVNGKKLSQSHAIARYIAREHGLAGSTAWESAICDQMVDAIVDLLQPYAVWQYHGKTDAEKEDARSKLLNVMFPSFCDRMVKSIKKNNAGWLVCDQVTWADVYLAFIAETLEKAEPGTLEKYPEIAEFQKKVYDLPNMKAYLEKPPAGNKSAKNGTKVSISKDSNVAEMQKTTIESNDWVWKVFFWSFLVILLAFGLCVLAYDWHSDWRIHKQSMREDMGSYRYSTLQRKDLDDVIDTCEEDDIDTSETPVDHGNPPILEVNTSIVTPAQLQNGNSWCGNANRTSATDLKQLLELDSDEELIH